MKSCSCLFSRLCNLLATAHLCSIWLDMSNLVSELYKATRQNSSLYMKQCFLVTSDIRKPQSVLSAEIMAVAGRFLSAVAVWCFTVSHRVTGVSYSVCGEMRLCWNSKCKLEMCLNQKVETSPVIKEPSPVYGNHSVFFEVYLLSFVP